MELEIYSDVLQAYADLLVQSMMFDMDVDIETMTLIPASDYKEAFWLTRWKDKIKGEDFDVYMDVDWSSNERH